MNPNFPNALTLSRIGAIPVLVGLAALQRPGGDVGACAVFALAGATDWLDGRLARRHQIQSELGACWIRLPTSCWWAPR